MINVRKFRVAVEVLEDDINGDPSWLDEFYVVKTSALDLPWKATLRSK